MPPDATATRNPIEIPPDLAPETHPIGATRNPGPASQPLLPSARTGLKVLPCETHVNGWPDAA